MKNDFSFDLGNEVAFADCMPIYDFDFLNEVREAVGGTKIEEEPTFRVRLKDLYDAAMKLQETLRSKMAGKLQKFSVRIKKAVSIFSAHFNVRAHRSPARSRSSSAAHDDDGGGSSESGDPDPPLQASHFVTFPKPKFQPKFFVTAVSPQLLLHGLSFFERGHAV